MKRLRECAAFFTWAGSSRYDTVLVISMHILEENMGDAERPPSVRWAILLLWASVACNTSRLWLLWEYTMPRTPVVFCILGIVVLVALFAWMIWRIGQGHYGAFYLLLLFSVLGTVGCIFQLRSELKESMAAGALRVACSVFELAAFCLLFTRRVQKWFQQQAKDFFARRGFEFRARERH